MAGANDEHRGAARSSKCDTIANAVAEGKCLVEIALALFGLFILVGYRVQRLEVIVVMEHNLIFCARHRTEVRNE
jgi:hypothetical protein